jgi:type IV secretion system protein VirD4
MAIDPFEPPRGGRGSQEDEGKPVPSNFWQPPEDVARSKFWRYTPGAIFMGWAGKVPVGIAYDRHGKLDDRHIVTVAGARAGKTSTLLIPNLALYDGSALVLDPKGELATATALHRRDKLGHTVRVLDPWGVAVVPDDLRGKFDPLTALMDADPRAVRDRVDDAALMAEALIQEQGENNAHWTNAARDFLRAAVLWFAHSGRDLGQLPELLSEMMAVSDKTGANDNPFLHMLEYGRTAHIPPDVAAVIRNAAEGTMGTQSRERSSILSTARNQLGFLESGPLRDNLAKGDFSLRDLKRKPMTIYLCLPAARMETHAKWLRLILNMSMAALEREPRRPDALAVLLMLEEFAALGHMRALEQAAAYMAGYGVKLWSVLQDLTQLKRHYKEGWETFLGNAGVLCAFAPNDMTTMEYLSKRLGQAAVYVEENQDMNEADAKAGRSGIKRNFQRVPLLSPDEVAMEFGRRSMRALLIPADGPPVAVERRFSNDPYFSELGR